MHFDLVDLKLFIAVADTSSITSGALQVHLALASASARIKGLEAGLGVVLLKRGRRGGELTAAGRRGRHRTGRRCGLARKHRAVSVLRGPPDAGDVAP